MSNTSGAPGYCAAVGRQYDELVRGAELFKGLLDSTLDLICEAYAMRAADEGSFFFQEQDAAVSLFLLAQGRVKIG